MLTPEQIEQFNIHRREIGATKDAALREACRRAIAKSVRDILELAKISHEELATEAAEIARDFGVPYPRERVQKAKDVNSDLSQLAQGNSVKRIPVYLAWLWWDAVGSPKPYTESYRTRKKAAAAALYREIGLAHRIEEICASSIVLRDDRAVSKQPKVPILNEISAYTTKRPVYEICDAYQPVNDLLLVLTKDFIGRESELAYLDGFLLARMAGENDGLLLITAPSGMGKSSIAAQWCRIHEMVPNRFIIRHFCDMANSRTSVAFRVLEHINAQLAHVYEEEVGVGQLLGRIADRLSRRPPKNKQVVVFLDGIDEARGLIESFLPANLGENICVIISARAENGEEPGYLLPFVSKEIKAAYKISRFEIGNFSTGDAGRFLDEKLYEAGIFATVWFFVDAIEELGTHPLMLALEAENIIENKRITGKLKLDLSPNAQQKYALRRLTEMSKLPEWPIYEHFFALMTVTIHPLTRRTCNSILHGLPVIPTFEAIPYEIRRWLRMDAISADYDCEKFSFIRSELRDSFREAIGWRALDAMNRFSEFFHDNYKEYVSDNDQKISKIRPLDAHDFMFFSRHIASLFQHNYNRYLRECCNIPENREIVFSVLLRISADYKKARLKPAASIAVKLDELKQLLRIALSKKAIATRPLP